MAISSKKSINTSNAAANAAKAITRKVMSRPTIPRGAKAGGKLYTAATADGAVTLKQVKAIVATGKTMRSVGPAALMAPESSLGDAARVRKQRKAAKL